MNRRRNLIPNILLAIILTICLVGITWTYLYELGYCAEPIDTYNNESLSDYLASNTLRPMKYSIGKHGNPQLVIEEKVTFIDADGRECDKATYIGGRLVCD